MSPVRLVANTQDRLGEGPFWAAQTGRLYWFDILQSQLNWLDAEAGVHGALDLPARASAAAIRPVGRFLIASEIGLLDLDPATGAVTVIEPFAFEPGFRTNDGKVDPQGRFWWSTMDDDGGRRPAAIYRTTADGVTRRVLDGIHIPNVVTCRADGARILIADSARQTIFEHDAETLALVGTFAATTGEIATPDGGALDAEGYLWNAQWGGRRLVRYAPDGSIDRIVPMPVSQPTSCAFGGPDLATLYVTSAWDGLSEAARAAEPLAGGLFAFEPGVRGLPIPAFGG